MHDDKNSNSNNLTNKALQAKKDVLKKLKLIKRLKILLPSIGTALFWICVTMLILFVVLGGGFTLKNYFDDFFDKKEKEAVEDYYEELNSVMKEIYSKYGVKINPDLITQTQFFLISDLEEIDLDKDLDIDDDFDGSDDDNEISYRKVNIKDIRKLAFAQINKSSTLESGYTCYTIVTETVNGIEETNQIDIKTYNLGSYEISLPYNEFSESLLTKTLDSNFDNAIVKTESEYPNIVDITEAKSQYQKDYPNATNIECEDSTNSSSNYELSYDKFSHYLRTTYLVHWKRNQNYNLENLPDLPYCKKVGESIKAIENCVKNKEKELIEKGKTNSVAEVENVIELIRAQAEASFDENNYDYGTSSGGNLSGNVGLSNNVLALAGLVKEKCSIYGIGNYTNYLLAIMMVESGGDTTKTPDVMQASESLGLAPNTLSTEESIDQGCKYFSQLLASADSNNIDINSVIQSYNYGGGFIDYISKNGNQYTFDLAIGFSRNKNSTQVPYKNAISLSLGYDYRYNYGNMFYVPLVQQYLVSYNYDDETVQSLIDTALEKLGSPYIFGAQGEDAFDCSSFIQYAYNSIGISLPRTTFTQYEDSQLSEAFYELENANPGDIVFFKNTYTTGVSHVGIYIGNNKMIHAANTNRGVVIDDLTKHGYFNSSNHFAGFKRVNALYTNTN